MKHIETQWNMMTQIETRNTIYPTGKDTSIPNRLR